MQDKWIVVHGNPVDGFSFVGPFDSHSDALAASDTVETEWWIASLLPYCAECRDVCCDCDDAATEVRS